MSNDLKDFISTGDHQAKISADISLVGCDHWTDPFKELPDVDIVGRGLSVKQFGAKTMPYIDFLHKCAEIDSTSFEREAVSTLKKTPLTFA